MRVVEFIAQKASVFQEKLSNWPQKENLSSLRFTESDAMPTTMGVLFTVH